MNRPWPVFEARWSSDLSPPAQRQTHPGGVSLPAGPFAAPVHTMFTEGLNFQFNFMSHATHGYTTQEVKLHKIFVNVWKKQEVEELTVNINCGSDIQVFRILECILILSQ